MTAMEGQPLPVDLDEVVAALRAAGARFAFLFGSRTGGSTPVRPDSDVDVAAWFGRPVDPSRVRGLPPGVDLLILDTAPLELRGRVAQDGVLVLDDDPAARVGWVATTRRVYLDELPRIARARRDFVAGLRRG